MGDMSKDLRAQLDAAMQALGRPSLGLKQELAACKQLPQPYSPEHQGAILRAIGNCRVEAEAKSEAQKRRR